METNKVPLKEFFVFFIVGVVATIVDWTVFYLSTEYAGLNPYFSVILSYTFGGATSYIMNKIFTFKDKSKDFALQISIFIIVMAGAYGLNLLFLYLQLDVLYQKINIGEKTNFGIFSLSSEMIARIITTGLVFIYNYIMHKFFTFNKRLLKTIKDKFTPKSEE